MHEVARMLPRDVLDMSLLIRAASGKHKAADDIYQLVKEVAFSDNVSLWDLLSGLGTQTPVISRSPLAHEIIGQMLRQRSQQ